MAATSETITVAQRFCGPPISGNGGWTCGALASHLIDDAEVTLRLPPPLETPMAVEAGADGTVALHGPDGVVATASAAGAEPSEAPPDLSAEQVAAAAAAYLDEADSHPFRTCFVCGPDREPADGLRIFSGAVPDLSGIVAAPWTPDESVADDDGIVTEPNVWAALDCAGGFSHIVDGRSCVLGRMAAWVHEPVRTGTPYIIVGWAGEVNGRKLAAQTALLAAADRRVVARATSTWIEVDPSAFT